MFNVALTYFVFKIDSGNINIDFFESYSSTI